MNFKFIPQTESSLSEQEITIITAHSMNIFVFIGYSTDYYGIDKMRKIK